MRRLIAVVVCVVACGDNAHAPRDASSDAAIDGPTDAAPVCAAGTADCDGIAANGCETSITTNDHCGGCTTACGVGATCSYSACNSGALVMSCVTPPPSGLPTVACASGAGVDSDGDGLLDDWELAGYIDVNCNGVMDADGTDVLLPDAHVNDPDLYVEIDYLEEPSASCTPGPCTTCMTDVDCSANTGEQCGSNGVCVHTHKPKQSSIDAVVTAMQRGLPATRPGIYLHIDDAHSDAIPEAGRGVISYGTNAGDPTDRTLDPRCTGPSSNAANFYDVKDQYYFNGPGGPTSLYAHVRRSVYHYALFVHYSSCQPGPPGSTEMYCSNCPIDRGGGSPKSGATGTSELPGNDVMVSLGAYLFDVGLPLTANAEGGTFMHELGHNIGLGHGVGLDGSGHRVPSLAPTAARTTSA